MFHINFSTVSFCPRFSFLSTEKRPRFSHSPFVVVGIVVVVMCGSVEIFRGEIEMNLQPETSTRSRRNYLVRILLNVLFEFKLVCLMPLFHRNSDPPFKLRYYRI